MIRLGEQVYNKRNEFLRLFIPLFQHYFRFLSNGSETVDIRYISQFTGDSYRMAFTEALPRDRAAQYCTMGIHKDDLEFTLEGFPVKRFGSQGQQKSFVIAVKLAQFEYLSLIHI